jgi:electron transfer flavoprotein beta subunit
MDIIVFVKPVLDPDLPPMKFSIDPKKNSVIPPEGMPPVMNPYDAVAVEAALQIKEKLKGKVTVVTLGNGEDVLRKSLAMGADEAVVVKVDGLEDYDAFAKAFILSQTVKKVGAYDLILCGRQAADWDLGATGSITAEYLGIPVLTRVQKIEGADGKLKIDRVTANGNERYEVAGPALITVSSEMGKARMPSGWGIINAAKKPLSTWTLNDIGGELGPVSGRNPLLKLYASVNERTCTMIKGENAADGAVKLADVISGMMGK